jgi:hypothetical protein
LCVLKRAELPHFTLYDLRHTYASLLLSEGVPLLYVSQQLGHAKPTTTLKYYAKWIPSSNHRYVNTFDRAPEPSWHQTLAPKPESKPSAKVEVVEMPVETNGGPCRDRTCGPLIKSQLLYQLS